MALIKFFTLIALAAVANAGYLGAPAISSYAVAAPVAVAKTAVVDYHNPHPQYEYSYGVSDAHTGDHKSAQESRNGNVVHGSYSLVEPDGTRRTVEYTADHINGFNAIVHRQPAAAQVAVAAAPVAFAAPVAKFAAAPISFAAPAFGKYLH